MPGILILEAMAQVGAVAILTQPEDTGKLILLCVIFQCLLFKVFEDTILAFYFYESR